MAGACLTIDLARLTGNWQTYRDLCDGGVDVSAVVKADAYGLGATEVGEALWSAGCRRFFVAHGFEGAALRAALPDAEIFVFHGALAGEETMFWEDRLVPVLGSIEAIERWGKFAETSGYDRAALHVDTGMNRLGLSPDETRALFNIGELPGGIKLELIMSHLACADDLSSAKNSEQKALFDELMALRPLSLGDVPLSLANSAGALMGAGFHYDCVRVGIGLYGGNPFTGRDNPLRPVVKLEAEILQTRAVEVGETVSYGATWTAARPSRIATIGVGYADGFLRSGGVKGEVLIDGRRAPIVGRVTMDLIMIDVTELPPQTCQAGAMVQLIGEELTVEEVASWSGTIGYEVLTALGKRFARDYTGRVAG